MEGICERGCLSMSKGLPLGVLAQSGGGVLGRAVLLNQSSLVERRVSLERGLGSFRGAAGREPWCAWAALLMG